MTSYYTPQPADPGVRPPCANCGAQLRLHRPLPTSAVYVDAPPGAHLLTSYGLQKLLDAGEQLACPEAYRPETLGAAILALLAAQQARDPARVFAARGEVQRHMDHHPVGRGHCDACTVLASAV